MMARDRVGMSEAYRVDDSDFRGYKASVPWMLSPGAGDKHMNENPIATELRNLQTAIEDGELNIKQQRLTNASNLKKLSRLVKANSELATELGIVLPTKKVKAAPAA